METAVCVDERGNEVACGETEPAAASQRAGAAPPGKSLQDQFTDAIAYARSLKGLEGADSPPSQTQRKKAERKARQAARRAAAKAEGGGAAPTYSPGCEPGDRICDRRARQQQKREDHAASRAFRASTKKDDDAAPSYIADAELAAALDADLEANADWGSGTRAPSATIPVRSPTR